MREIKFRGMGINGDWYYGYLSESQNVGTQPEKGFYISNSVGMPWAYNVRPETVGQYTGLKDCKGVEIFEGDILTSASPYKFTYVVAWREHGFSPFLYDGVGESYREDYEVIGNIHQNPELLEDE